MIFEAKLKVGMSFVITLLTAMKKTLTMMMILMILIMMLMTMTSRRRVMTRTSRSCHECQALVSEEIAFSFVLCRSLERILFSGFCNSLASST